MVQPFGPQGHGTVVRGGLGTWLRTKSVARDVVLGISIAMLGLVVVFVIKQLMTDDGVQQSAPGTPNSSTELKYEKPGAGTDAVTSHAPKDGPGSAAPSTVEATIPVNEAATTGREDKSSASPEVGRSPNRVKPSVARGRDRTKKADKSASSEEGAPGYVTITSVPNAKIEINKNDIGRSTPVTKLALAPGRHKVTFVVGDDRFTFPVTVETGKTVTLHKVLP